jgi:hypothetical protein
MKLRIKGNSLRIRLTRSEVNKLADTGYLQEQTIFPNNTFIYALQSDENTGALFATLDDYKITMHIPASFIKSWPQNDIVGIDATMPFLKTTHYIFWLKKILSVWMKHPKIKVTIMKIQINPFSIERQKKRYTRCRKS